MRRLFAESPTEARVVQKTAWVQLVPHLVCGAATRSISTRALFSRFVVTLAKLLMLAFSCGARATLSTADSDTQGSLLPQQLKRRTKNARKRFTINAKNSNT
jgi:hypothetical protein